MEKKTSNDLIPSAKATPTKVLGELDLYLLAFQSSPIGIAISRTSDNVFVDVNDSFLACFGFTRDEVIGHTAPGLKIWAEPAELSEFFSQLQVHGRVDRSVHKIYRKTGIAGYVSCTAVLMEFNRELHMMCMVTDITETIVQQEKLRESELRYKTLFERSPSAVLIAGIDGYISVNQQAIQLWNAKSEEDFIGKTAEELFAPECHEAIRKNRSGTLEDGLALSQIELKAICFDGSDKYVSGSIAPIYFSGVRHYVASVQDITDKKVFLDQLYCSNEQLQLAQKAAGAGLWDWDVVTGEINWSNAMFTLFGVDATKDKAGFESWKKVLHPEDLEGAIQYITKSIEDHMALDNVYRIVLPDGEVRWINAIGSTSYDANGKPLRSIGLCMDITSRKLAEEQMQISSRVFRSAQEGIMITDMDGHIVDINEAFTQITGYTREDALWKTPGFLKSGHHEADFYATVWNEVLSTGHWVGEIWNRRKNGELFPERLSISAIRDGDNRPSHYVGIFSDITNEKLRENNLIHMAQHDPLTSLPNRILLEDRMSQAIAQAIRESKLIAICFLDLDDFKPINDCAGHDTGDEILIEVAKRVSSTLRAGDTVARVGGDEFALLLVGLDNMDECKGTLDRLLEAVAKPIQIINQIYNVSASIGVTFYPQGNTDIPSLLHQADLAMYQAKKAGRNNYKIYNPNDYQP